MMKKNKLAVLALLFLLCLSVIGCLFSFFYVQVKDISLQKRLELFGNFKNREKEFQVLEQEYNDWQNFPDALQKLFKDNMLAMDEFAAFRRDLDSSLAANQLQPSRIDFTFSTGREKIKKVNVKFSLEGSYRNVKKFIFDMEIKPKMYFIDSMTLSAAGTAVKGVFTLEVYLGE